MNEKKSGSNGRLKKTGEPAEWRGRAAGDEWAAVRCFLLPTSFQRCPLFAVFLWSGKVETSLSFPSFDCWMIDNGVANCGILYRLIFFSTMSWEELLFCSGSGLFCDGSILKRGLLGEDVRLCSFCSGGCFVLPWEAGKKRKEWRFRRENWLCLLWDTWWRWGGLLAWVCFCWA